MTGMFQDFMKLFPWAITIVLMVSLLVAELIVPFMQFWFIRKLAKVEKTQEDGQICHRNGVRTITVMADVADGVNVMNLTKALLKQFTQEKMPSGVTMTWGGEYDMSGETMPQIVGALVIAVVIIFFILLGHFKRISTFRARTFIIAADALRRSCRRVGDGHRLFL